MNGTRTYWKKVEITEKNWEKEFDKYVRTDDHLFDCIGYSEGQECCLDRAWIKDFIKSLISSMKEDK